MGDILLQEHNFTEAIDPKSVSSDNLHIQHSIVLQKVNSPNMKSNMRVADCTVLSPVFMLTLL